MANNKLITGAKGLAFREPLIFEIGSMGRSGVSLPAVEVDETDPKEIFGDKYRPDVEGFPEVSEAEVVRHFVRLSHQNFNIDSGMYPLGSCTMKYNPKCHEKWATLPRFAEGHPYLPEDLMQGTLELMHELERYLAEICGMDAVTLQPAAGAHGELTGLMLIDAWHRSRGDNKRTTVLVPDTAHGTNPASSKLAGFEVKEIKSDPRGLVSAEEVKKFCDESTAALMMTNPNTLGIFESEIHKIAQILHERGALLYCDGANLNALMGIARPGDMGVDVIQINLHKTFSTPHGGGGPGSGPVAVKKILEPFLPEPRIEKRGNGYHLVENIPTSIGKVRSFFGNFGVMIKAYAYIRSMGAKGLKRASQLAVLNANYLRKKLSTTYHQPYNSPVMHECVFNDHNLKNTGVTTLDIAKRLIDYGFHPPTIYFPLVVHGALMIEPTETESPETLDAFVEVMEKIAEEARTNPEVVKSAPHNTMLRRLDETQAARKPILRWTK